MAMVAAGGPIANVIVAVGAAVGYRLLDLGGVGGLVLDVGFFIIFFNLLLAIFNLLPIPPLDGYNVVLAFLPPRQAMVVQRYAPYGILVLLLLVFVPGSPLRFFLGLARPLTEALIGA
jgi:Zn-dependent protease